MSESEEAIQEEIPQPEVEELELDSESTPEEIDRASRQGWTDRDGWAGDPEKWVPAKEFLRRGEETLPILKKNYERLESQFNELKSQRDKDQTVFKEFQSFQEQAKKRIEKEFQDELKEIKNRKAQAVRDSDSEAFARAEQEEEQLREQQQEAKKSPPVEEAPKEHPDFKAWLDDNPWYNKSRAARVLADSIGQELGRSSNLSGRAFFDEVAKEVEKELPQLFQNPNRSRPSPVEPGGGGGGRKSNGKSYADLPAGARQACDNFCKTIPGYTKEQYLKDYDWSAA